MRTMDDLAFAKENQSTDFLVKAILSKWLQKPSVNEHRQQESIDLIAEMVLSHQYVLSNMMQS